MRRALMIVRGLMAAGLAGTLAGCNSSTTGPASPVSDGRLTPGRADGGTPASGSSGTLRLRCERRPDRSKISVDGKNITPRNGVFSARVTSGGVTIASGTQTAVGDEVEFDFDSEPDDIRAGATAIPAGFIVGQPGEDVRAEVLNAQGTVVVSTGAECPTG